MPVLLNEVHSLIQKYHERYKFALSGSSALKELLRKKQISKGFVVYAGEDILEDDGVKIYPFSKFCLALYDDLFTE